MEFLISFVIESISMLKSVPKDLELARIFESLILLFVIWSRLKPHLKVIEKRLAGLEIALNNHTGNNDARFRVIEQKIAKLEGIGGNNGNNQQGNWARNET